MTNTAVVLKLCFCLLFICSCGKKKTNSDPQQQEQQEDQDGVYYGELSPLNSVIVGQMKGFIKITKNGDELIIRVKASGVGKNIHYQYLHSQAQCPEIDLNGDGVIDAQEIIKQSGKMILPFDGDLSSQTIGYGKFPKGNYDYRQSTSYYLMLADLQAMDEDENDEIIKINSNAVDFANRSLIIYGASRLPILPSSVQTYLGRSVADSMPVACARIEYKLNDPVPDESSGIRVKPRPRPHHPSPEYHPPAPPASEHTSWWERLSERLKRWWCRVRKRCA